MKSLLSQPANLQILSDTRPRDRKGEETAASLLKRHGRLQAIRNGWEPRWQSIKDLVRPETEDFTGERTPGAEQNQFVFDGTSTWALDQFASGVFSSTTPQTERWFAFRVNDERLMRTPAVLTWLEYVSDLIYSTYSDDSSSFNPSMHESALDIGAFGTSVIFQDWSLRKDAIRFKTIPLASCWISENDDAEVDTLHRETKMTARNAMGRFGDACPEKIKKAYAEDPDKEFTFVHIVMPNEDATRSGLLPASMQFASYWVCKDTKDLVGRGGYRDFPYAVPRWKRIAGQTYGISPAMDCLPDIRVVNEYEKLALEATQLIVAPPTMVPHDGFIGINANDQGEVDISPRSLMFYENPEALPKPYREDINLRMSNEMMDAKRQHISNCFLVDVMRFFRKNERQTAQEVLELRDERMRMIGPMVARLQSEKCGPMLKRTFSLLNNRGLIPANPPELDGMKLEIEYVSPAAMAQQRVKSSNTQRWILNTLTPLSQMDPSVMDIVDVDAVASESAIHEGASRRVIRTPEAIAERRNARQQQEQMSQMAAMGTQVAAAAKDLSTAGKNFPSLLGIGA